MKKKQGRETLAELLSLIPILNANPGIQIEKLKILSGFSSTAQLRRLLHKLIMFGTPPFSPGDFIDIYIDEQERIFLEFPQGLDRPLALTPAEWTAVRQAIIEALEFQRTGEESKNPLRDILSQLSEIPLSYEETVTVERRRNIINEALEEKLQIEFLYKTLSSKEPEIRHVDPWAFFQHHGVYYLIGFCHLRLDARFFHMERMENIEILDITQQEEPPVNLLEVMHRSPIFRENPIGISVRVAFTGDRRSSVEALFQMQSIQPLKLPYESQYGWFYGDCKISDTIWLRTVIRSLGPKVILLAPEHLRKAYRAELEEIPVPEKFIQD